MLYPEINWDLFWREVNVIKSETEAVINDLTALTCGVELFFAACGAGAPEGFVRVINQNLERLARIRAAARKTPEAMG